MLGPLVSHEPDTSLRYLLLSLAVPGCARKSYTHAIKQENSIGWERHTVVGCGGVNVLPLQEGCGHGLHESTLQGSCYIYDWVGYSVRDCWAEADASEPRSVYYSAVQLLHMRARKRHSTKPLKMKTVGFIYIFHQTIFFNKRLNKKKKDKTVVQSWCKGTHGEIIIHILAIPDVIRLPVSNLFRC